MNMRHLLVLLFVLASPLVAQDSSAAPANKAVKVDSQVIVFMEAEVEQRPSLLSIPPLRYPDYLRQMGVEGRVIVRAIIGTNGRAEPKSIDIVQTPDPGFNAAARDFVWLARFSPAKINGRPVRMWITIPIDFKIRR